MGEVAMRSIDGEGLQRRPMGDRNYERLNKSK